MAQIAFYSLIPCESCETGEYVSRSEAMSCHKVAQSNMKDMKQKQQFSDL
jgi:hypothetical protein